MPKQSASKAAAPSKSQASETGQDQLLPYVEVLFDLVEDQPDQTEPEQAPSLVAGVRSGEESISNGEQDQTEPEEMLLPSHDEAKTLCELAQKVKELAPWQWLEETNIFGVEDPDTGELGFISIMGHIGEYEAVAVYRGAEGLYGYIDMQSDPVAQPERIFEIPQVQVAFLESRFLEKPDRELLKSAGLKSRGGGSFPQFRSYRPGYHAWFITRAEARLLINALSQTLNFVPRLVDGSHNFQVEGDFSDDGFLVRAARREGDEFIWDDEFRKVPRPVRGPIEISVDDQLLDDLKRIPRSPLTFEVDLVFAPAKIGERGARPMTMYLLIVADSHSGYILGFEAMTAAGSLTATHAQFPEALARVLSRAEILPRRISLRSKHLLGLLKPLAKMLDVQLRYAEELPNVDEAAGAMGDFLMKK
jgi:hypothetical protein